MNKKLKNTENEAQSSKKRI